MTNRLAFLFIAASTIAAADQLTLTNGRRITGSFLDGNARTIRFVTGETAKTFAAGDVATTVGTTYRGTLVAALPTPQNPLIAEGSNVVLKLVNDDASGPINGAPVLTLAVVSITTAAGKPYDVTTVRVPPSAPPSGKFSSLKMAVVPPVSATGDRVHVPYGTILMFTLAEPATVQ